MKFKPARLSVRIIDPASKAISWIRDVKSKISSNEGIPSTRSIMSLLSKNKKYQSVRASYILSDIPL